MNLHMAKGVQGEGGQCERMRWGAQLRTQAAAHRHRCLPLFHACQYPRVGFPDLERMCDPS